MTIYLYLKTHNVTGLKYLGKTISEDPYSYQGSGKYWKRHIEKHGYDVTTEILLKTNDKNELKKIGLYYSNLWNIVESKTFANIIEESGDGGAMPWTESSRKKLSKSVKGKKIKNTENMKIAQQKNSNLLSLKTKEWLSKEENYKKRCEQLRKSWNKEKVSKSISELKWCNDGIKNYRLKEIPSNYFPGRLNRKDKLET